MHRVGGDELAAVPDTPGNRPDDGEERLADGYRRLSGQLARAWALCGKEPGMDRLLPEVQFYEEVRVYMAKFDAENRRADSHPSAERRSPGCSRH